MTEEVECLDIENSKTLVKEIEKTQINGNICCVYSSQEILKMCILHKLQIQCSPYQNFKSTFTETEKAIKQKTEIIKFI